MNNGIKINEVKKHVKLPVTKTKQIQDGCVTASARAVIPHLGVDFDEQFLPSLLKYQLDQKNPEYNHMLGVAVVGAELGLQVVVHKLNPRVPDVLPPDVPEIAKRIHPKLIEKLCQLEDEKKLTLIGERLDNSDFYKLIRRGLEKGMYIFPFLDWARWNKEVQSKYGNPRHVVVIFGLDGEKLLVHDPSLEPDENPVEADVNHLYQALNNQQQLILLGKKQ